MFTTLISLYFILIFFLSISLKYCRHGKTTLLRHIAERLFDVPPSIDILYCEQEVVADETSAVKAVLRADTRCTELLAECKKLEEAQEKGGEEDVTERLNEVYFTVW